MSFHLVSFSKKVQIDQVACTLLWLSLEHFHDRHFPTTLCNIFQYLTILVVIKIILMAKLSFPCSIFCLLPLSPQPCTSKYSWLLLRVFTMSSSWNIWKIFTVTSGYCLLINTFLNVSEFLDIKDDTIRYDTPGTMRQITFWFHAGTLVLPSSSCQVIPNKVKDMH